jgi:MFS family permease
MPLYALLTRESFGVRMVGTAYGGVYMIQAVGMGPGSFAGGWFHNQLGDYRWFFVASAAIAAAAVLLGLTLGPQSTLRAKAGEPLSS